MLVALAVLANLAEVQVELVVVAALPELVVQAASAEMLRMVRTETVALAVLAAQQAQVALAVLAPLPLLLYLALLAEQVELLEFGARADQVERQDQAELVVRPE